MILTKVFNCAKRAQLATDICRAKVPAGARSLIRQPAQCETLGLLTFGNGWNVWQEAESRVSG